MSRRDLDTHFNRLEQLVDEMNQFVPAVTGSFVQFRADLAGLLVVSIAATYETCVKETLVTYANGHHAAFGNFAVNNFKKLNSRITIDDLRKYTLTFDDSINKKFTNLHDTRKKKINDRIGRNIESCYKQILSWRNDFAHAGIRNTTIEEAIATHRVAKRVLYTFDQAFNGI